MNELSFLRLLSILNVEIILISSEYFNSFNCILKPSKDVFSFSNFLLILSESLSVSLLVKSNSLTELLLISIF